MKLTPTKHRGRVRGRSAVAAAVLATVLLSTVIAQPAGAAPGDGTLADHPTIQFPHGMVRDFDGNVWFGNGNSAAGAGDIGRIDGDTGQITFVTDSGISNIADVAVGPLGRIYFTSYGTSRVGYVDTRNNNAVVLLPTSGSIVISLPVGLAVARGRVYVASSGNQSLVEYSVATGNPIDGTASSDLKTPQEVLAAPDRSVYVAAYGSNRIWQQLPEGSSFQPYEVISDGCGPFALAAGAGGSVWFTCFDSGAVGSMQPNHAMATVAQPGMVEPFGIAAGPDGRMWFGNDGALDHWAVEGPPNNGDFEGYSTSGIDQGSHVAVDGRGNVWMGGYESHNLQRIQTARRFSDVPVPSAFAGWIGDLANSGITSGFTDGSFRPTASVTRQAMIAFLWRLAGEPTGSPPANFTDVAPGNDFIAAINWAKATGVSTGFNGGTTFRPGDDVTRQAAAAFFYRQADSIEQTSGPPTFTDVGPGHPFFDEIEWLAREDIAGGFANGSFRPADPVTRQAMAAFLMRFQSYLVMVP